ncbi:MAG: hypothetical protein Q7I91_08710 [Moraxellaceae bacterium]|nr:hypothetical protein [Moraxellaceae bacterium]
MSQPSVHTRFASLLLIPLVLSVLFVPTLEANWLYLVLGVVLGAWPLALAERALAARANQPLIAGMQVLTRQSDAAIRWRVLAWSSLGASVLLLVVIALYAGAFVTQVLQTQGLLKDFPASSIWSASTVIIIFFGVLRRFSRVALSLWLLPTLALAALLFWQMSQQATVAMQTELSLLPALPGEAMLLAGVLLGGAGAMIRWPVYVGAVNKLTVQVAAVLLVLAAVFFASLHHGSACMVATLLSAVLLFLAMSTIAEPAITHVQTKVSSPWMASLAVIVPVVLLSQWISLQAGELVLQAWLQAALLWMALNALILATYTGWIMKISHARKALQLPSEGVYNLWRIAIRWVVPITLLVALYQWFSLS